jgi:hypothetical protein
VVSVVVVAIELQEQPVAREEELKQWDEVLAAG